VELHNPLLKAQERSVWTFNSVRLQVLDNGSLSAAEHGWNVCINVLADSTFITTKELKRLKGMTLRGVSLAFTTPEKEGKSIRHIREVYKVGTGTLYKILAREGLR
jgi:hypothetical protein